MKDKICLFAGTTEGRILAGTLKDSADLTVCVATEYGEDLLEDISGINVRAGRLEAIEMKTFFANEGFSLIIDATHPYATVITENIREAADECGIPVMRILRDTGAKVKDAVYVSSAEEAADWLSKRTGNVFLFTGAKELSCYKDLDPERVWARVLPLPASLEACAAAGIPVSHIVAAQGPFSYEVDFAELKAADAAYMVTKASGKNGGFDEKIRAARDAGAIPVIIGTPPESEGISLEEAISRLTNKEPDNRKISIIGIGPGNEKFLTKEAMDALTGCDAVIGASSVAGMLNIDKQMYFEYLPVQIKDVLESHPEIMRPAIVMRGDVGFFSGTKKLLEALKGEDVNVIPGISSVVLLASRLGTGWDDASLISLHGRNCNVIRSVSRNRKSFILTGGDNNAADVIKKFHEYGMDSLRLAVGEKLSFADERIIKGTTAELLDQEFDSLSVIYAENDEADKTVRTGINDDEFIRGNVPMTKSEIRAISMSKLSVSPDSVVWDVGAGTGSVSVECALSAYEGEVFAVEKNPEATALLKENAYKFRTDNIHIIEGSAPEALEDLPAPTHVFIGGSSGNLKQIISLILSKNKDAVIVVNTVTLETQAEVSECVKYFGFEEFEAVSAEISRSRKAGSYNLMTALNPVWIFRMRGGNPA